MGVFFERIAGRTVLREWGIFLATLSPTFKYLPLLDLSKMKADIEKGTAVTYEVLGEAKGYFVLLITEEDGDLVAWIGAAAGSLSGGPKHRLAMLRSSMKSTEEVARQVGCKELRIYGRNFARIFPDFVPLDGVTHGLRKVLRAPLEVQRVSRSRIECEWPAFEVQLRPAVRRDPQYRLEGLYRRLLEGTALMFEIMHGGCGLWVVSLEDEGGQIVAWTTAIAGKINGGPKWRLSVMRNALAALEATLQNNGVVAHRFCGRNYVRLFPDYRPHEGFPNGLEKVLA